MELHFAPKPLHHNRLGDEKHQMLNLNRRLETYLSRVKHLEEENAMLAEEIGALRRSKHGTSTRRKGLEEELRQARLELEAAWRDKAQTEMEVGRLAEEIQFLDQQRQWEAQAHVKAKKMLEQNRKELDEEQRAQMWLRQQVSQLEQEMNHLIQTHRDDVAHMESTLIHSTATRAPVAPKGNQTPDLLQLGQEFSQRATRAWQEAAEAHQVQLAQLEEALNEARGRLTRVAQEKSECQLGLRALEKEMESAQDVRLHLEKTAAQQRDKHDLEIQQMQAHLEGLEAEREDLGRQIKHLLLEKRGLLQTKMSLALEVSTYRALLDSEGIIGDRCPSNRSRDISMTDAVFCPQGTKKNYGKQPSASVSSLYVRAAPPRSRNPTTFTQTPKTSTEPADKDAAKSETWESPYPKILQDGAVESFRPQEVQEKVTHAEPLSPPDDQEACVPLTPGEGGGGGEVEMMEAAVSRQMESSLLREESSLPQSTAPSETEESRDEVSMEAAPAEAVGRGEEEHVQEVTSTPSFESGTRGPATESVFNQITNLSREEHSSEHTEETREDTGGSVVGPKETDTEDKMLYPDGKQMDTWDSVIERKVDMKTDDGIKEEEAERQHAEAEDISAGEPDTRQTLQDVPTGTDKQVDDEGQEHREEDEEEDSRNAELESDSYAQDNTLADTRPLIRYKSDETDANTQASHLEESESSEGEQDRRPGETGGGAWSESKSRRYGTMEDLCEEVEEEELDEERELGYTRTDEEEMKKKQVSEEESDEETFTKPTAPTMDEELETDRLVEQELESLSTDSFSCHLAQQQVTAVTTPRQLMFSNTFPDQQEETSHIQRKDEKAPTVPEEGQGHDEHSVLMVTHPDEDVHFPSSSDVMEDLSSSELRENSDVRPEEPQECLVEACPHVPETGEWEVLENPSEDSDIRDKTDLQQDSAERLLHDEGGSGEEAVTHEEEHLELSPDSMPHQMFAVEDTKRKDIHIPGVFSSGVKTDFWTSSSGTGAACQSDDAYTEQTNQNVGFGQDPVWGMSDMRNGMNGNSPSAERGQEHEREGKQSRKVEVEFVHSEESEVEAESWSSGEEQV